EVNHVLTASQKSCAMLLDHVREIGWTVKNGKVLEKPLKSRFNRDAYILQRRGIEQEDACTLCESGRGVFGSCVAAPDVTTDQTGRKCSLFAGSCANCLWHGKAAECSFYLGRNGG
ncbi:DUF3716 domain-containing protein, partial [Aspergillus novofumigatus IBT 16806]